MSDGTLRVCVRACVRARACVRVPASYGEEKPIKKNCAPGLIQTSCRHCIQYSHIFRGRWQVNRRLEAPAPLFLYLSSHAFH